MINIYEQYNVKPTNSKWNKFRRVNRIIQQSLKSGASLTDDLFALRIVLNDQLTIWYNSVFKGSSNHSVNNQISGITAVLAQTNLTTDDKKALSNQSFMKNYWNTILICTFGLHNLVYGYNLMGFISYFSVFYLLPFVLYLQTGHWAFDLLLAGSFAGNLIFYYRKIKLFHFTQVIEHLFEESKQKLLSKYRYTNG